MPTFYGLPGQLPGIAAATSTYSGLPTRRMTYLPTELAERVGRVTLTDEELATLDPALALECVLAGEAIDEIDWGAIQPLQPPIAQQAYYQQYMNDPAQWSTTVGYSTTDTTDIYGFSSTSTNAATRKR